MATASSSGKAVRDDRCRNTRAGDLSDCAAAMANTELPDEEIHESGGLCSAPSTSFYHSTRIQRMIDAGSHEQPEMTESSTVQAEIEASKVTWSELANTSMPQTEDLAEKNQKYFECFKRNKYGREADQIVAMELSKVGKPQSVPSSFHHWWSLLKRGKYVRKSDQIVAKERLKERMPSSIHNRWAFLKRGKCVRKKKPSHSLFRDYDTLIVGEKLAEGGQAEIYAASVDTWEHKYSWDPEPGGSPSSMLRVPVVVKVFKAGTLLSDLEKQWPPALLKKYEGVFYKVPYVPNIVEGATLLKDERLLHRFAFVMPRYWGDLRKLIDHRMIHESHNWGPPFLLHQISKLMWWIADDMRALHAQDPPILHRDLKAANVLVGGLEVDPAGRYYVEVADFECSVGVVGTGFWRAPEILLQLKHRDPDSPVKFTKECDVYSYGMLCYEIVTGRIPFEDCSFDETRELVLKGVRLELPMDLVAWVKDIIVSCWHADPSERPSFEDIVYKLIESPPIRDMLDQLSNIR